MPGTIRKQRKPAAKTGTPAFESISIADAKTNLTSIVRQVEKRRIPITIVRRGVPVAQVAPITVPASFSGYGWMRGTVQEIGDIVGPTGEEWTVGDGE